MCKMSPSATANPIKENVPKYNLLVSYQFPCGVFSHHKLWLTKSHACYNGCPQGLGSCCGDRPALISGELRLSSDAEGAKAESEIHLKGLSSAKCQRYLLYERASR